MTYYRRLGYSESWINQRLKSIDIRKELTDEWKHHGLEGVQCTTLNDIICIDMVISIQIRSINA